VSRASGRDWRLALADVDGSGSGAPGRVLTGAGAARALQPTGTGAAVARALRPMRTGAGAARALRL